MSDEPIRFETFVAADQQEVKALILAGLGEHWGTIDESVNVDLEDIAAVYGYGRTIVARDGLGVAATGTCVPHDDETAMLLRMSVRSDRRRSGHGRAAVEELVKTAATWDKSRVILETFSAWDEVVTFYLSCGFRITHIEDGEFGSDTWFERLI